MIVPIKNYKHGKIWVLAFIVVLIAVYLRLLNLGTQGMFLDEAFSWLHSQFPVADLLVILTNLNHTPLYFFLLKYYLLFVPQTEFGLRSLSVIFSILSLISVIVIMYRWWGTRAAIFSGWLIAISSFEIYYAQDVRMYTMLSLLWVISTGLLLEILTGSPKLLLLWGISLVLISHTHVYGLILAFVQSGLIAVIWVSGQYRCKKETSIASDVAIPSGWSWTETSLKISIYSKWVLGTGVIVALGVLPIIWSLLRSTAWRSLGGGVWVPTLNDLPTLYLLAGVGLTAGRNHFLDNFHLVIPVLRKIPNWLWMVVAVLLPGSLAIMGSVSSWKMGDRKRWFFGILLLSSIIPILIIWFLGWIFQTNTWAYKSFLGVVLLFYMLAGIGFSIIRISWIRWVLVVLSFGIALASLIPYYTIWTKDNSKVAFSTLPNADEEGIILMERAYMSPLAHFYLGAEVQVLGLPVAENTAYPFLDAEFGPKFMYGYDKLACDEISLPVIRNVWIYGNEDKVRERLSALPGCFGDALLWIFEDGTWIPFEL